MTQKATPGKKKERKSGTYYDKLSKTVIEKSHGRNEMAEIRFIAIGRVSNLTQSVICVGSFECCLLSK